MLVVYDAVMVCIALVLSILLRYDGVLPRSLSQIFYLQAALFVVSALLVNWIVGNYNNVWKFAGFAELIKHCFAAILIGILLFTLKFVGIIRLTGSILFFFCITYLFLTLIPRFWSRFSKWVTVNTGYKISGGQKNVMVIGAGYAGAALIERMFSVPEEGLRPVAVIDDDPRKIGGSIHGLKVVGDRTEIPSAIGKYGVEEIIISIPSIDASNLREIYKICTECHVDVRIVPSIMDFQDFINMGKGALKQVSLEDLLFRDEIHLGNTQTQSFISGKTVLVTGGAGSIGSEICRQVMASGCKHLIIFDFCENGLFEISNELSAKYPLQDFSIVLGSVRDMAKLNDTFKKFHPEIVLHAAAHKHVPLMQGNPVEAIKNNVFGTDNVAQACIRYKAQKFILVSTDKAVNPVNVMGATKRFAELLVQTYNSSETKMAAVRFGNVLGSAGSVIPTFKKQIAAGGPVTVTHPDMQRYFMTIPEAVALVLKTGAIAEDGGVFILDMGKPVKIYDLACDLIKLCGLRPHKDIEIEFTGIRPGEKLYEELSLACEDFSATGHEKIFICRGQEPDAESIARDLALLAQLVEREDGQAILESILPIVHAYGE